MIAYFDTSAIVKLLIEETGSATAETAWHACDARLCCTVGIAEAAAAIGRAQRTDRIAVPEADRILADLSGLWRGITRVLCDDALARHAAELAVLLGLRGYDAIHLAAALSADATLVAGDGPLLRGATACGLATVDVAK